MEKKDVIHLRNNEKRKKEKNTFTKQTIKGENKGRKAHSQNKR